MAENIDPEPLTDSPAPDSSAEPVVIPQQVVPATIAVDDETSGPDRIPAEGRSPALVRAESISPVSPSPAPIERIGPAISLTPSLRLENKHPLAIRWMHWINFPVLATMIWSGLLIYWNDSIPPSGTHEHSVYRIGIGSWTLIRLFPKWFWDSWNAAYRPHVGLGYHFFFMWFFMLNGLAYVLYTGISGEWRYLLPTRNSFKEAMQVTLHDLGLSKAPLPLRKFNGAQQIAYTSVILMGLGSLITGLAIYKPSQAHLVTLSLGGYKMARWLHFWLTMGYCVFFVIHISQVARAGWNNFRAMVSGYEIVPASQPNYRPDR
jgi:thiosulfate reductase cytochrome b subunit